MSALAAALSGSAPASSSVEVREMGVPEWVASEYSKLHPKESARTPRETPEPVTVTVTETKSAREEETPYRGSFWQRFRRGGGREGQGDGGEKRVDDGTEMLSSVWAVVESSTWTEVKSATYEVVRQSTWTETKETTWTETKERTWTDFSTSMLGRTTRSMETGLPSRPSPGAADPSITSPAGSSGAEKSRKQPYSQDASKVSSDRGGWRDVSSISFGAVVSGISSAVVPGISSATTAHLSTATVPLTIPTSTVFSKTTSRPYHANPSSGNFLFRLYSSASHDIATLFASSTSIFWLLLVLSAPLGLYIGYIVTIERLLAEYYAARHTDALATHVFPRLWNTRDHWVLSSLVDTWLRGLVPGNGMWTPRAARSLRAKKDKSALQALVRMGIYPLYISDGGLGTSLEEKGGLGPWGGWHWPLWRQSKRRAVFEFVVPRARGWPVDEHLVTDEKERLRRKEDRRYLQFLLQLCDDKQLRRATRWRVAVSGKSFSEVGNGDPWQGLEIFKSKAQIDPKVPVEVGAESRFKWLLPFLRDRVLRGGVRANLSWARIANWVHGCQLLESIHVPVVRVEAPDDEYIELDKEVFLLAHQLGLDQDWDERIADWELRKAYRQVDLDPNEHLKYD